VNRENSCFINSTVQALASLPLVHSWLAALVRVQRESRPKGSGSEGDDDEGEGGSSLLALLALLRALCWPVPPASRPPPLAPVLPVHFLPSHIAANAAAQHDAHELLVGMLEAVEGSLGGGPARKRAREERGARGAECAPVAGVAPGRREWAAARMRASLRPAPHLLPSPPALACPFTSLLATRVVCMACAARRAAGGRLADSAGADPPWRVEPQGVLTVPYRRSLVDSLLALGQDERIHGYACGNACGGAEWRGKPSGWKQSRLVRPPAVLALHVNRLQADGVRLGGPSEMGPTLHLSVGGLVADSAVLASRVRNPGGVLPSRCAYELSSVVVHRGGSAGGHYVAYRRLPQHWSEGAGGRAQWVCADDATTFPVLFEAVTRDPGAYLLLYSRVGSEQSVWAASSEDVGDGEWLDVPEMSGHVCCWLPGP
jgi:hypothetical protein